MKPHAGAWNKANWPPNLQKKCQERWVSLKWGRGGEHIYIYIEDEIGEWGNNYVVIDALILWNNNYSTTSHKLSI